MKAWIFSPNTASDVVGVYQLVFSLRKASEMTEHNAHYIMRKAETDEREYTWETKPVPGSRFFIVEGTKKQARRSIRE